MKIKNSFVGMLLSVLTIVTGFGQHLNAANEIEIYTPDTKISVAPGESLIYNLQVINHSNATKYCNLSISGVPKSWDYSLKSGSYNIKQVAVLPNDKQKLSLKIDIPLKVNKGNYPVTVYAGNFKLPLIINISKQGSSKTEFTSEQANMEGHSTSSFTFKANLKNRTDEKQLYALRSKAPRGWQVTFKPNFKQATSVEIEENSSKDVSVEIKAPQNVSAGTYKIPVTAVNNQSSADLNLEVVIIGTYNINLTTPTCVVSTSITAGGKKETEFIVQNTGSVKLSNIKLSASKPSGWTINFSPSEIPSIEPGSSAVVKASISADSKAMAGDYMTNISAKVPEISSKVALRISVKTPMIWGWIGILIIVLALGSIIYLFIPKIRKEVNDG